MKKKDHSADSGNKRKVLIAGEKRVGKEDSRRKHQRGGGERGEKEKKKRGKITLLSRKVIEHKKNAKLSTKARKIEEWGRSGGGGKNPKALFTQTIVPKTACKEGKGGTRKSREKKKQPQTEIEKKK